MGGIDYHPNNSIYLFAFIYFRYALAFRIKYYAFIYTINFYHNFIWGNSPQEK